MIESRSFQYILKSIGSHVPLRDACEELLPTSKATIKFGAVTLIPMTVHDHKSCESFEFPGESRTRFSSNEVLKCETF